MFIMAMPFLSSTMVQAASVQTMQSCQGLIDFLHVKLKASTDRYSSGDIKAVSQGLNVYNTFIQRDVVTPGLLKYSKGDKAQAQSLQDQVDAFRASIVKNYSVRFPENKLYMDFVVALNNCTKDAAPRGDELETLKASMMKMVELIKAS